LRSEALFEVLSNSDMQMESSSWYEGILKSLFTVNEYKTTI
jgi:hypothetical protein